ASMLAMGAVGWAGYKVHSDPALWHAAVAWSARLLIAVAFLKVASAGVLLSYLVGRNLIRQSSAASAFMIWTVSCCMMIGAILAISAPLRHAIPTLAATVILFVPLVRPALAILLLHYN